jgi:hypothetical protein
VGAARAGATDRPRPWLLAAAGCALPLAAPSAELVGVAIHAALAALALTVAAAHRHHAAGAGTVAAEPGPCLRGTSPD